MEDQLLAALEEDNGSADDQVQQLKAFIAVEVKETTGEGGGDLGGEGEEGRKGEAEAEGEGEGEGESVKEPIQDLAASKDPSAEAANQQALRISTRGRGKAKSLLTAVNDILSVEGDQPVKKLRKPRQAKPKTPQKAKRKGKDEDNGEENDDEMGGNNYDADVSKDQDAEEDEEEMVEEQGNLLENLLGNDSQGNSSTNLADAEREDGEDNKEEGDENSEPKRKEKSLATLCARFVEYHGTEEKDIVLGDITDVLKINPRRIYDIVNVLEAIGLLGRLGKSHFKWFGMNRLQEFVKNSETKNSDPPTSSLPLRKAEKLNSLASFAKKFLVLLLKTKPNPLLVEDAVAHMCGDDAEGSRTKVRRLYDVANIFSSLKLVIRKKTVIEGLTKTAYHWIGFTNYEAEDGVAESLSLSSDSLWSPEPPKPKTPTRSPIVAISSTSDSETLSTPSSAMQSPTQSQPKTPSMDAAKKRSSAKFIQHNPMEAAAKRLRKSPEQTPKSKAKATEPKAKQSEDKESPKSKSLTFHSYDSNKNKLW